ncbi:hypothetical protein [Sulfurimonas sp. NWX79]|uniref:hypothetical protein n=1 Tax=Sulfurimonas sp. NWX79 TaxID=2925412 RepID=UPI00320490F4
MNRALETTYNEIKDIFENVESFASVELIEKYRKFWKPNDVKVILLAESHVFTSLEEMEIELVLDTLKDYPKQYSKFVYCLAYGEKDLTKNSSHPKRDGTPQFWKIFYSCVNDIKSNECFRPIQSSTHFDKRIKNKIDILNRMKDLGIWLVDTSIVALYDNGKKPKNMPDIIKKSWEGYTKNIILDAKPNQIVVIGKGVAQTIEKSLIENNLNYTVIAQPNAHLSSDEHLKNFQSYYKLCNTN